MEDTSTCEADMSPNATSLPHGSTTKEANLNTTFTMDSANAASNSDAQFITAADIELMQNESLVNDKVKAVLKVRPGSKGRAIHVANALTLQKNVVQNDHADPRGKSMKKETSDEDVMSFGAKAEKRQASEVGEEGLTVRHRSDNAKKKSVDSVPTKQRRPAFTSTGVSSEKTNATRLLKGSVASNTVKSQRRHVAVKGIVEVAVNADVSSAGCSNTRNPSLSYLDKNAASANSGMHFYSLVLLNCYLMRLKFTFNE